MKNKFIIWLFVFVTSSFVWNGCGSDHSALEIPEENTCIDGIVADTYPCQNIDLLAHLTPGELKGDTLNDIWGWTDPETGKEYALVGLTDGVSFVDISDPQNPEVIGKLVETSSAKSMVSFESYSPGTYLQHEKGKSDWRDFKVYKDHLFVISDNQQINGIRHGMQVFDLNRLREMAPPAGNYHEDVLYAAFNDAHNIAINEETGYAYVVGSDTYGGGLHIINIRHPLEPKFAGFHADSTVGLHETGYVHDTQCVIYRGPDEDYQEEEVCFSSSETHLVVANVTQKDSTFTIAKKSYGGNTYAHQGWLTEDQQYFLLDDELDESRNHFNTRTYVWDVRDLDNPQMIGIYESSGGSIDHNQYIKRNYTYQANYTSGLRILDITGIASGRLEEVAYFDTHPADNRRAFDGAWSTYPFFRSGVIIVSDMTNGLFVLRSTID